VRLGQHFLKNKKQIGKIVDALDLQPGDFVIELGPGHGELTFELAKQPIQIVAIEKDEKLVEVLKSKFEDPNIITGDLLKELPKLSRKLKKYKLVGNIPYYLTGYLLRTISELENKPSLIVFTIQKEVAKRLTAKSPKMNLLAASVQYWAEPKIVGSIPARDFRPAPKVDSAIVRLNKIRTSGARGTPDVQTYYKFIKILFSHPRKTILNNLSSVKDREKLKEILKKQGIKENARPQDLSVEKIRDLFPVLTD